jgi:hypothetical protein
MKNEQLYPEYLTYLDNKLNESKISKGKYSLLKISRSSFNDFIIGLKKTNFSNKV